MSEDLHIFETCISSLHPYKNADINELITRAASCFIGTPYVGYTLDREPEALTLNLRQFDCQTFIESMLAIAKTIKEKIPSFDHYCRHLQNIRYRHGIINNYNDRLMYFSDWITENQAKGYVKDITKELGGTSYSFTLHYCSSHPEIYKQLRNESRMAEMKQKEAEISGRNVYSRIDKNNSLYGQVRNGDILAFTTNRPGLEITHVALAYYDHARLTFIHATSINSKTVVVSPLSLQDYMLKNSFITGLMVARPL